MKGIIIIPLVTLQFPPKAEKPYNLGQLNGELKEYYPNGKLKEQTNYINNEKHGESKFYNESGKLIKEKTYFDDEVFSEKIYK